MAKIVEILEVDYAARLREQRHPLLGHPTISVGMIHGGVQPNIVPAHCHITADRRTLPGENPVKIRAEIKFLLKRNRLQATISDAKQNECAPMETDPDIPLVKTFMRAMGQKRPMGVHYFCDAAVISKCGIPSVVFGPGNIAQAHTDHEWISLASLERGTAMLVQFLKNLS
jgi:acetylornithine deacetylase